MMNELLLKTYNEHIDELKAQNTALVYALEATYSVIEDLSDTGDLDREGTLGFLAEAIRKAKE